MDDLAGSIEHSFGVLYQTTEPPFRDAGGHLEIDREALGRGVFDQLVELYDEKAAACERKQQEHADLGYPDFTWFQRDILLRILDSQWKDHLHTMDGLREGILTEMMAADGVWRRGANPWRNRPKWNGQ